MKSSTGLTQRRVQVLNDLTTIDDPKQRARTASQEIAAAERYQEDLRQRRNHAIRDMANRLGMRSLQIAESLGMSKTQVNAILRQTSEQERQAG